ncbi:hypothetical protein, partial [Mesorhizobium sp.]|uniref:hypothetical protein n=1 Tax=Mesorhizobium sp. TaxID=1871066 RepID=UPI0025DB6E82
MAAVLPGPAEAMDLLAEQLQPAVLHGIDQIGGKPRGVEAAGSGSCFGREHGEAVAPAGFGGVAGIVGAGERIGYRRSGIAHEGDADAGGQPAGRHG